MASTSDFSKLKDIEGVGQYILVRNDGHIVTHNTSNAVELSSTIVMSGQNCKNLENFLDCGQCMYLCIERNNGNNLLVFPLGKYFLGIVEESDSDTKTTVDSIINYLRTI